MEEFDAKWERGEVKGWEDRGVGKAPVQSVASIIDVNAFIDIDDLESVGADRLKQALQSLGLKCGGTPRQRAERLYLLKGRSLEDLDPIHFAKGPISPFSSPTRRHG